MAKRRKADYNDEAQGFGLLSEPTRLGIMAELVKGPRNVGALAKAVGRNPQIVGHHLGLLRMGGLITGERQGKTVVYAAQEAPMKALAAALSKITPK